MGLTDNDPIAPVEGKSLDESETPEQRRERLKALAKTRVDRLVAGETLSPHMNRFSNLNPAAEAISSADDLFHYGSASFTIRRYWVQVTNLRKSTNINGRHYNTFAVEVDGVELDSPLLHSPMAGVGSGSGQDYVFGVPEPLRDILGNLVRGRTPYEALSNVIGNIHFSDYFPQYTKDVQARRVELERIHQRIKEEAENFQDILVRKYTQLVYRDEYETLETTRFRDELKRFAGKRLPDLPASVVAEVVFPMVARWVEEQEVSTTEAEFDLTMSPTEYERFCANRFSAIGWAARLTKGSGDQGADIICEANNRRMVIQCKLYTASVGNAAVQEVIAAREYEYADLAAVVSNAPFTPAARELASAANVVLLHHDEICKVTP